MKIIANPSPKEVLGRASECMRRLLDDGLLWDAVQKPINDPEMRRRLVRFWNSGGFEHTTSQKLVRKIMGKNFFGVEEAIQHLGAKPTKAQLSALAEIPYIEAELREVKDTHVLVAVLPLSILDIRGKVERQLYYSHEDAWYNNQAFAKDHGEVSWQLVRKAPVPDSTSKNWAEQQALLAKNEETPKARVMIYAIIGHYLATGERLFENTYVRCSDVGSYGYRVYVGSFNAEGLNVDCNWDDFRYDLLGVSSARKSD